MKIAVLWSSPNEEGLTASAKNKVMEGIVAAGAEAEEIPLNRMHLEACKACGDGWGSCRAAGVCVLEDDFHSIYQKLVDADGIVLVSAVYWSEMTEQMKLLMDRLRRCEATFNHYLSEKRILLVACAGGTGNGATECLEQMERTIKHMGMRAYDRLPVTRYNREYMLPALFQAGSVYVRRLETGFDMYY